MELFFFCPPKTLPYPFRKELMLLVIDLIVSTKKEKEKKKNQDRRKAIYIFYIDFLFL